jgi:NhaP-type Na+/H+ or K+/H+ antiporter
MPTDIPLELTLQIIITVMAGIGAQVLAAFVNAPAIVFLLLFGVALGSSGVGVLHPDRFGDGLEVLVGLLVAIILFEGGFNLQLRDLGRVSGSLRNLVTIGTLITLIGGGLAAHWLSEFPWDIAFLYASLVVVTGPTVITPLLRLVKVDRRVAILLEGEGVLIDPVGAILAVVVLDIVLNGDAAPWAIASGLLVRLSTGAGIGGLGGYLLGLILKRAQFLSDDLKTLVVLAGMWGLFGLAQLSLSESGLMATVAAGIVLRASALPEERLLKRFKGQLTILAVSVLFILLAADLSLAGVFALGWGGLLTVLALMLVVRPLNIGVCTWNSGLNWRQKLFLSWVAPRGIVSASVASLFAIVLTQRGINGGEAIKALVFLTIILTVVLQGLTAQWVANALQIASSAATGAVIVGCNPLSVLIGRLLQDSDQPVILIDTAPAAEAAAAQENLPILISSALDTNVLERAGVSSKGTFLAMTNNAEVNLVIAQRAAEEFEPPRVLAIVSTDWMASTDAAMDAPSELPRPVPSGTSKAQPALLAQVPLKIWNQRLLDDAVKLGETLLAEDTFEAQQVRVAQRIGTGDLLPLLLEREARMQPIAADEPWQPGDRLLYLLHDPKPKLLKALSGSSSIRLTPEKLPELELPITPPPAPTLPETTPSEADPSNATPDAETPIN